MSREDKIEMIITSREKDLGGFSVRRILPYASHRMVGPFIFFDHMGPAHFKPGDAMDVRPHPHIGLATVTYLFEGQILHRDSLGSKQTIEPGAINWMTAGKGIVHSERATDEVRKSGQDMNGIQVWVALPKEHEQIEPSFVHHPANALPEFKIDQAQVKLLIGSAFGHTSPVRTHSDLFYIDVRLPAGGKLHFPAQGREAAAYVADGSVMVDDLKTDRFSMAVAERGEDLYLEALTDSRVMLLGGMPVGERFIHWNFVASSKELLEEAKKDWASGGPRETSARFKPIPDDHNEFIPLPEEQTRPKGTIM
jgi:redox-sensitive bicupin YhaK (pirin superfamily)